MNRKVTLTSVVATMIFLMILVILGIILQSYPDPSDPLFSLLATLFIGCFLAIISCMSNISTLVRLSNNDLEENKIESIVLSSCPEYWRKEHTTGETGATTTMCVNEFTDTSGSKILLSETRLNELATGSLVATYRSNFSKPEGGDWINTATEPGSYLIDLGMLSETTNTCDLVNGFAWTEAEAKCQPQ